MGTDLAYRLLCYWLNELWESESAILNWLTLWNRTPPVEGRTLKCIYRNFMRLLVSPLHDLAITERGLFLFGLKYSQVCMDFQSMTTQQRAAAYAAITFSPYCFESIGLGNTDETFSERGFVIHTIKDKGKLPCFPTEEFTRLFCLIILQQDIRTQPILLSAFDDIWIGNDNGCFQRHNKAFYQQLRSALDAYDPIESLQEMVYIPWETKPLLPVDISTTVGGDDHQIVMRKETDRERRRRLARESRMAQEMSAYVENRKADHLNTFAQAMGVSL